MNVNEVLPVKRYVVLPLLLVIVTPDSTKETVAVTLPVVDDDGE